MSQVKPAGPRSVWGAGFVLGASLLLVAWLTFPSPHMIWELPLGIYLVVICMGKMVAR